MSTDKTLADVKPGGRVRLGDQTFAQGCDELRMRTEGERTAYLEGVAEGRNAALSAQPSPGGQGDALLESLVARWRRDADEIGISDNTLCQKIASCTMRHATELQAALAARQPVGEPVARLIEAVEGECDGLAISTETATAILTHVYPLGQTAVAYMVDGRVEQGLFFNRSAAEAMAAMNAGELVALFRQTAQAEDLGAIPDGWILSKKATCYQLSNGNDIVGNLVGPDAEKNASIIARVLDSKAVGK